MKTVTYKGNEYIWNGFWGFFFLPAGPKRKKEKMIKEGTQLYDVLRKLARYP